MGMPPAPRSQHSACTHTCSCACTCVQACALRRTSLGIAAQMKGVPDAGLEARARASLGADCSLLMEHAVCRHKVGFGLGGAALIHWRFRVRAIRGPGDSDRENRRRYTCSSSIAKPQALCLMGRPTCEPFLRDENHVVQRASGLDQALREERAGKVNGGFVLTLLAFSAPPLVALLPLASPSSPHHLLLSSSAPHCIPLYFVALASLLQVQLQLRRVRFISAYTCEGVMI